MNRDEPSRLTPVAAAAPGRDVIVIGASAGGHEVLVRLFESLPADLGASIFIVCHLAADTETRLPGVLGRAGQYAVKLAEHGEPIRRDTAYVAPADRHLLVKQGRISLSRGPRENHWRPSIDALFRSAAVTYGSRVIGIVMSGMLDDGTAGLAAIKQCGGTTIVQDPAYATYSEMPATALANVPIDFSLEVQEMRDVLQWLVRQPAGESPPVPQALATEACIAETGATDERVENHLGILTPMSCPDCGGPLWQHEDSEHPHFRCRVGHAWSARSLNSGTDEMLEATLWAAVRLFQQRANIATMMADREKIANRGRAAAAYERRAAEAAGQARVLREFILNVDDAQGGEAQPRLTAASRGSQQRP
jgi:two-component system chemotaxis response regulator CheB